VPELRFDDRVAIVTGAGGGLGREHALALGARGCKVVVNDLGGTTAGQGASSGPAEAVAKEIELRGGTAVADAHTVVTPEGAQALVQCALDLWGRVDIVVNNAGIVSGGPFDQLDDDVIDRVLAVHVRGAISVTRAAWPHLLAQGYGRIVNTSSGSTFGTPGSLPYPMAKSAIIGFTRCLALEGRRSGITANAIMPVAYTRMTAAIPDDRFRSFLEEHFPPSAVAPLVTLLAHEDCPSNGELFTVGAGRVARVFLGVAAGHWSDDGTPEDLLAHWDAVTDLDGYTAVASAMEDVGLYFDHLGWQRGEITMG
jgi:NAD(P)-dependent dehydrogenase (short-subunit alcohol dehydrogenase family)